MNNVKIHGRYDSTDCPSTPSIQSGNDPRDSSGGNAAMQLLDFRRRADARGHRRSIPAIKLTTFWRSWRSHGLTVKAIVITHAHIDHIGGAAKLKAATGAPVYMNANDQELYDHLDMQASWLGMATPARTEIDSAAREGDALTLGETPSSTFCTRRATRRAAFRSGFRRRTSWSPATRCSATASAARICRAAMRARFCARFTTSC